MYHSAFAFISMWRSKLISFVLIGIFFSLSGSVVYAQGLYGEYFNAVNFGQEAPLVRIDSQVNFNWGNASPMEGIQENRFSVRWRGWFIPRYSETYWISTRSDDGVRVWVGQNLLIQNWTNHAPTRDQASIDLVAGEPYYIQIEYFENRGGAVMELNWESDSQPFEAIPSDALIPFDPTQHAHLPELRRIGLSFNRPLVSEGFEVRLNAFRLGQLDQDLVLPLRWIGEGVDRFVSLPRQITIPAHRSVGHVNLRCINDEIYQGSTPLSVEITDEEGDLNLPMVSEGTGNQVVVRDDESRPNPTLYTIAGLIEAEGIQRFEIQAIRLNDEEMDEEESNMLDRGRSSNQVTETLFSDGSYSLALLAGQYRLSVRGKQGDQWLDLETNGSTHIEIEVPPHHLNADWVLPLEVSDEMNSDEEEVDDTDLNENEMNESGNEEDDIEEGEIEADDLEEDDLEEGEIEEDDTEEEEIEENGSEEDDIDENHSDYEQEAEYSLNDEEKQDQNSSPLSPSTPSNEVLDSCQSASSSSSISLFLLLFLVGLSYRKKYI